MASGMGIKDAGCSVAAGGVADDARPGVVEPGSRCLLRVSWSDARRCDAMGPFQEFVRDRVAPALKEVGYVGRGVTYRFLREGGHVAVFWLHQWRRGEREIEFFVDEGIVVRDWVDYIHW